MQGLLQDFRYAARLLLQKPAFTVIVAITLALGIGASTAIFSIIDAVLLRPLPFPDPARLVVVWENSLSGREDRSYVSPSNFQDWRDQSRSLQSLAAVQNLPVNFAGFAGEPEELPAQQVSAALFPLLAVPPILGRGISDEEDQPGHNTTVVLSYGLWQRRFGGDRSILGRTVRISDLDWTVVGVMPPDFRVLNEAADLWLPLALRRSDDPRLRAARSLIVLGRLKPGVSLAQAQTEMAGIGSRLALAWPAVNSGWSINVMPLREELVGDVRLPLLVVLAAVGLLLLIACANVGNMMLARSLARSVEFSVRGALGAGRFRIARQLLTESVLLGCVGGFLGLPVAWGGIKLLHAEGPQDLPRLAEAHLDVRLFAFALVLSIAAGALFGLAPAVAVGHATLAEALMQGGRASTISLSGHRVRRMLLISEIALAVLLVSGAGLMVESFRRLSAVQPGFDPQHVLSARVLIGTRNAAGPQRVAFFRDVLERISRIPGVESAAAVSYLPVAGLGAGGFFRIEGRPAPPSSNKPVGLLRAATPDYFRTMRIPLLAGRNFEERDTASSSRVVMINETLARRYWNAPADALGSRLIVESRASVPAAVIGVVGDVKAEGLNSAPWAMIYAPHSQMSTPTLMLVIRCTGDPLRMAPAVSRTIYAIDSNQPVAEIRSLEQVVAASLSARRFQTLLLGLFALIALVLAGIGIYGLVSYQVGERTREIGLRMALGAQRREVLHLVVREAAMLALIGLGLGIAAALALTRLMHSLLFSISESDPWNYALTAAVLLLAAVLAAYLPARRAVRVDPTAALHYE